LKKNIYFWTVWCAMLVLCYSIYCRIY